MTLERDIEHELLALTNREHRLLEECRRLETELKSLERSKELAGALWVRLKDNIFLMQRRLEVIKAAMRDTSDSG